jgi:hypothetical protein
VRVSAGELDRIAAEVEAAGRRYSGDDLSGAVMDCDFGLEGAGFTSPKIKRTGEPRPMVIYRCRPDWDAANADEIVSRLEDAWETLGKFRNEVHAIRVAPAQIEFDFVTWWDDFHFYTGRIDVELAPQLQSDE